MFLKSIELFGFKSFPERTKIDIEPGVTVIVGPNGCGKSNVVDAIKWVLGEKQARNIRGTTMEDIIFTGTDQRKQLSLAEVSVTIDNSTRVLDFDSDAVTVGRRVFRDGESEYLINKSPVRLKDIEKLFMDTGIGKSAYSVMEQGKMDLILSTRAEDRRYIFEEAAGISRYKLQKKESLKKLRETSDNLARINDIIREIEREKDLKAKQAEKTRQYLALRDKLKASDIRINYIKFNELLDKQKKLQADIEKHNREREAISSRVSSTSAENEKDEKRKNDLQLKIFEEQRKLDAYKLRLGDIDKNTDKNRRLIEEEENRRKAIEKSINDRTKNLAELIEEKKKAKNLLVEIAGKLAEDKEKLDSFYAKRKRKIESINASRDRIEQNRDSIKTCDEALKSLRDSLEVVIKKLIDAIEKRKEELSESEAERQNVRNRINQTIKNIEGTLQKALSGLESGLTGEAAGLLRTIDLALLRKDIDTFESFEDGFRSILFDKTGIHARKVTIDKQVQQKDGEIRGLRSDNAMLEDFIRNEQAEIEDVNSMINRISNDISSNETEKEWIERNIYSLENRIKDFENQIENFKNDYGRSEKIIENLKSEIEDWEKRLVEFNDRSQSLMKEITELTEKRSEIDKKIHERKDISKKDEEDLQKVIERISSLDRNQVELIYKKEGIEEHLWTEYEKRISELNKSSIDASKFNEYQDEYQDVKKRIQELGPINNLAIEEFNDLKKRFEYYIEQRIDIEKASEDILSVIEEINSTSIEMFINTFKEIKKNFSEIFKQLFNGGEANLEIIDLENVLESGIDIMVRPPGKKLKNITLLSGGERALTAIALLFATYMVKPSPFCFLDEIDAPLDEENIGRFVKMLREFARGTQFVIVTHNKKTMSIGESVYGVTMEEAGVSKVVSLKMEKIESKN